jgi:hypothetical protein
VTVQDAMDRYFEYEVLTLCGIPEITLEGTVVPTSRGGSTCSSRTSGTTGAAGRLRRLRTGRQRARAATRDRVGREGGRVEAQD